jgi:hypothetical protein
MDDESTMEGDMMDSGMSSTETTISDETFKLLALMRFWLFGTFLIVWAALTIFIGLFSNRDWWLAIRAGFPIWGVVGALCIIWYFVYKFYLNRKDASG